MKPQSLFELTCNMIKANVDAVASIKDVKQIDLRKIKTAILVEGEMGIGKSQIIRQAARHGR